MPAMKRSNTTLIILVTLVVAAGAYWYFFTGTEQAPLTPEVIGNEAQTHFQALVSELTPISFNTEIFSDPRFNALTDLRTPIAPESAGRLDPFAPVTSISGK